MRKWKIFHYNCPTEQVGISWHYAGTYEAIAMTTRPQEAKELLDNLYSWHEAGVIDGESIEVRFKPRGKMEGSIVVLWNE